MLILAFPEIRWLFCALDGYESFPKIEEEAEEKTAERQQRIESANAQIDAFRQAHGLHHLFCQEPSPVFDGSGLREWIRKRMRDDPNTRRDGAHLPKREKLAVSFDEESDYAYLHAYTAYRFGFRAAALTTKAHADCVLGTSSKYDVPKLTFEDLFLNLPDSPGRYSWLGEKPGEAEKCPRHENFPRLEEAAYRVLVTSGHRPSRDEWEETATEDYICQQATVGKRIFLLHKPHAGIFSIWSRTSLNRCLKWTSETTGRCYTGTGDGFIWPPPWRDIEMNPQGESTGHSAPGIFVVIVEHMLDRAGRLLDEALSVEDILRGAVIATDALELLGGKTPTMAIAALSLKQQLEAKAVLQFAGAEYHLPVDNRLAEIRREVEAISRWFHKDQRKNAMLNAEMSIIYELVRLFRQYSQFDEEQICMNRARHLEHSLWMRRTKWGYVFLPVLRYAEFLLSSIPKFCVALLAWLLVLSLAFAAARHPEATGGNLTTHPWGMALSTFFGAEQLTQSDSLWIFLTSVAVVAGLAHLGIFISHLYTLVSRR